MTQRRPSLPQRIRAAARAPLVEGTSCTFFWRGRAEWVGVEHRVVGLPTLEMRRARGSDVWYATVELPAGARVEYRIAVRVHGETSSMLDPCNDRVAYGPVGEASFVTLDDYVTPWWAEPDPTNSRGDLITLEVESTALQRAVATTLYVPEHLGRDESLPLLVLHDGSDFLRYSALSAVLDNLMHHRLMARCAVAAIDPGERLREYGGDAAHATFVLTELVPALRGRLRLAAPPQGLLLGGASFGAVASLATAMQAEGGAGGLLLQSASLRASLPPEFPDSVAWEPVLALVNALRESAPHVTPRIFQSYGAFEPLAESNRAMTPVLRRMADEVLTVASLDGHNWTSWRDRLGDGLVWLLPGERAAEFAQAPLVGEGKGVA